MESSLSSHCSPACQITSLVPMVHVADVDQSIAFYQLLGFECQSRFSGHDSKTNWAAMVSGSAKIFLARADGPIDPAIQAVLFYMYSADVIALKEHLKSHGFKYAGPSPSVLSEQGIECEPGVPRRAYYDICHPFYMPLGELRVHDLDGYVILVGQLG